MQVTNTQENAVVVGHVAEVFGATSTERKLSIVHTATAAATMALAASGGKVGKVAIGRIAVGGLDQIATAASHANYRPAAEYFAAELGETFIIKRRADFESLPSQMEARVYKAKQAKNGGMRECKKTGALIPGATLARALRLHALAVDLVAAANAKFAERAMAALEADKAPANAE